MTNIIITGVPRSGKTTLSHSLAATPSQKDTTHCVRAIYHSDIFKDRQWSEQSRLAMSWLDEPGPWICEGVTMIRAVRKWMKDNPEKPCDVLYFLVIPKEPLSPGQYTLAKGCQKIFNEIYDELIEREVDIKNA